MNGALEKLERVVVGQEDLSVRLGVERLVCAPRLFLLPLLFGQLFGRLRWLSAARLELGPHQLQRSLELLRRHRLHLRPGSGGEELLQEVCLRLLVLLRLSRMLRDHQPLDLLSENLTALFLSVPVVVAVAVETK